MPDTEDETTEQQETKGLRKAAEEGAAAKRELEQMKRENALLKAGVDMDSKMGQMFAKGYDGGLDVDSIKAEWLEIQPAPKMEESTETTDTQARERMALAGEQTPPGPDKGPDPRTEGIKEFQAAMQRGVPREDAAAHFFNRVIDAAAKGDDRALYVPPQQREY